MKTEFKLATLGVVLMYSVLFEALLASEFIKHTLSNALITALILIIQFGLGMLLFIKNSKDL